MPGGGLLFGVLLGLAEPSVGASRVAVTSPRFEAEVPTHVRSALSDALVDGLHRGALPVDDGPLARGEPACASADCLDEQRAGAQHLVRMRVDVEERDYILELELLDEGGAVTVRRRARCELCGVAEASDRVAMLAAAIIEQIEALPTGPARLIVRSDPAGATIQLDGHPRGTTPTTLTVVPGEHELRVERAGHSSAVQTISAAPESEQRLDFRLVPTDPRRPRVLSAAGTGLMAGGVVFVGVGAVLWALDGRPYARSCPASGPDMNGRCPEKFGTLAAGLSLTALGIAALGTGVGLLAWSRRGRRRSAEGRMTARLVPGPSGLTMRF